jgi:prephenate dehydrogenase
VRTGILGTGLIGASMGLGLRHAGWHVVGWDPDAEVSSLALDRGAVDEIQAPDAIGGSVDVVVLAGPPLAVVEGVRSLETDALVVDVAGVKLPVASASRVRRYVGTHPMAGREISGPAAASAHLFRGATWVVVPGDASETDLALAERMIADLGGRPFRMAAEDHDRAVAAISHLPQLLASTLMNEASDRTDALDLVAGSFRDLTRVAASDPAAWVQLLSANRGPVIDVLEDFIDRLQTLAGALSAGDLHMISEQLDRARTARRSLGPRAAAVRVALADEPGELARVGHAFDAAGVDIRDLQLRHAPYGGGGVLTVSVRSGDEAALRSALQQEGLMLAD